MINPKTCLSSFKMSTVLQGFFFDSIAVFIQKTIKSSRRLVHLKHYSVRQYKHGKNASDDGIFSSFHRLNSSVESMHKLKIFCRRNWNLVCINARRWNRRWNLSVLIIDAYLLVSLEVLDWCINIRKYIVPISNVNVYISDGNKCKQDIRPLMLPISSHGEPNLRDTEWKCRKTCIIPSVWYRWGERGTVKSLSRTPFWDFFLHWGSMIKIEQH